MKIRSFNDKEHIPEECGSFTILSRALNKSFKNLGVYSQNDDAYVIVPESLNTQQKFVKQIPLLACEYSLMPQFVIDWLNQYVPPVLCISNFAANNLINSGYPKEKVHTCLLGVDSDFWRPVNVPKFKNFTFISVNTSNDRSAYEISIIEFLKFAADKPEIRLIIKDGKNENFKKWLKSLNSNQIIYIDDKFPDLMLRELICRSHYGFYINHTTSFGFLNLQVPLCGVPNLCTHGSAIREIVPTWTQPPNLIKTHYAPLNEQILTHWRDTIGLHTPPNGFYPPNAMREVLDPENIVNSLDYVYNNYSEMIDKNKVFASEIKKDYTWDVCANRIIKVLENE